MSVAGYGNFVGVPQIQRARVSILRTALDKSARSLCDRNAQWLTAENEKVTAALQISFDCPPVIGGNGGAVRKHQQLRLCESTRRLQRLRVKEGGIQIVQRCRESGAVHRLAGDCRESRLPEDYRLGQKRRGKEWEQQSNSKNCAHRLSGWGCGIIPLPADCISPLDYMRLCGTPRAVFFGSKQKVIKYVHELTAIPGAPNPKHVPDFSERQKGTSVCLRSPVVGCFKAQLQVRH